MWDPIRNCIEGLPKHWAYILLCLIATLITIFGFYIRHEKSAELLAHQVKETTDLKEKINLARLVLETNPNNNQVRLYLANSLAETERWNEAEKEYNKFIQQEPDREWVALTYLSFRRGSAGNTQQAIEAALRAIELHGDSASPYLAYAYALDSNEPSKKAFNEMSYAIKLPGDEILDTTQAHAYANVRLAINLWERKPEKAEDALVLIKKGNSLLLRQRIKAYYLIYQGLILESLKKYDEALKCFNEAINIKEIEPYDKSWALDWIGAIYYTKKELQKSIEYRVKALEIEPKRHGINNKLGYAYLDLNERTKAEQYFTEGVKATCCAEDVETALNELVKLGKSQKSISLCNDAINTAEEDRPEYMYILGKLLFETGQYKDANDAFYNAINSGYNKSFSIWEYIAKTKYMIYDYKGAVSSAEKSLLLAETNEDKAHIQLILAHCLIGVNEIDKAGLIIDKVISTDNKSAEACFSKARWLLTTQNPRKAYLYLKTFIENFLDEIELEEKAALLSYSGLMAASACNYELAIKDIRASLSYSNPNHMLKPIFAYLFTEFALKTNNSEKSQKLWTESATMLDGSYEILPPLLQLFAYLAETRVNIHSLNWKEADMSFARAQIILENATDSLPSHLKKLEKPIMRYFLREMKIYEKAIRHHRVKTLNNLMSNYKDSFPVLPLFDLLLGR